jgi:hypothetical protein
MSLVGPKAVAHSSSFSDETVPFPLSRYLVDELTVTVTVTITILGTVGVLFGAVVAVDVVRGAKERAIPCRVIVDPDTAVTFPNAVAELAGTAKVVCGIEPVGRG